MECPCVLKGDSPVVREAGHRIRVDTFRTKWGNEAGGGQAVSGVQTQVGLPGLWASPTAPVVISLVLQ